MSGMGDGAYGDSMYGGGTASPDAVCLAIQVLVRTLLGMPAGSVRQAEKDGPADDMPLYATVKMGDFESRGWDDDVYTPNLGPNNTTLTETVSGQRTVVASIQFIGLQANVNCARLASLLQTAAATQQMNGLGIGLGHIGKLNDLSAVIKTLWQDRAQRDIEFFVIVEELAQIQSIGSAPVTIQFQ
jgi:hypothetical protein